MKHVKKMFIAITVFIMAITIIPSNISIAKNKIRLNKTSVTLNIGEKTTLKVKGTSKKIKWNSLNKKIATVSKKGVVKGKKEGITVIIAKVLKNQYACKIKVKDDEDDDYYDDSDDDYYDDSDDDYYDDSDDDYYDDKSSNPYYNDGYIPPISKPTITPTVKPTVTPTITPTKGPEKTENLLSYNSLAAYGWIAIEEYAKAKKTTGSTVTINKIYIAEAYNDKEELTVAYQCAINGKQYYYATASYVKGEPELNKFVTEKHLKIRGLDGYYIPSIGGTSFQEQKYFDMYYQLKNEELDYFTIKDLHDKYIKEANYQVIG